MYCVSDSTFLMDEDRYDRIKRVIGVAYDAVSTRSSSLVEVNGVKLLFHENQSWNTSDAHSFLDAAWSRLVSTA